MSDTAPATDPDCVFCKIVAGDIPAERIHEDDEVIAFHDMSPKAPVHVLVVPREHRPDVRHLSDRPELLGAIVRTATTVADEHADGDFRLIFNTGENAGQTVMHVHAHVLAGTRQAEGEL